MITISPVHFSKFPVTIISSTLHCALELPINQLIVKESHGSREFLKIFSHFQVFCCISKLKIPELLHTWRLYLITPKSNLAFSLYAIMTLSNCILQFNSRDRWLPCLTNFKNLGLTNDFVILTLHLSNYTKK